MAALVTRGVLDKTIAFSRTLAEIARISRPSRKPQLWEDFGFYLKQRIAYTAATVFVPNSLDASQFAELRSSGVRIEILPRRLIGQSIFLYGIWEISGTRLVELLLRPGMRFIDVGANVGYYTLVAAHCVGPLGRVDSFEPHDTLRAMLERSVRANGFTNVHVHQEAVTETTGSVAFYAYTQENEGVSSTIPGAATRTQASRVPAVSLDDFVQQRDGDVDLIKIDVEGAEREVFAGMRGLLTSPTPPGAILFESSAAPECADLLRSSGYEVMGIYYSLGRGLEFIDVNDQATIERLTKDFQGQPTLDYLALRQARPIETFNSLAERSRRQLSRTWRMLRAWT
jgi:FkbM family methyltransferase